MPDASTLAIVIVSYNVRDELDACLQSIVGRTQPLDTTIVVVDNGSTDGTPDLIRARRPGVRVIEAGENLGFARANNVGIRATTSDLVLLLNPDTVVPDGAIQRWRRRSSDHPMPRASGRAWSMPQAGPSCRSAGRSARSASCGRRSSGHSTIGMSVRPPTGSRGRRARPAHASGSAAHACSHAAAISTRSGLFDERYFMYTEDVDLCASLRARGRAVLFDADVTVTHRRGHRRQPIRAPTSYGGKASSPITRNIIPRGCRC